MLGMVIGNVDSDFRHRLDAEWMNVASGLGSGTFDAKSFSKRFAEDAFGEMGAAAVARAENEDTGWFHIGKNLRFR
jgi:hypothetical protein